MFQTILMLTLEDERKQQHNQLLLKERSVLENVLRGGRHNAHFRVRFAQCPGSVRYQYWPIGHYLRQTVRHLTPATKIHHHYHHH
jgi:hypothetical protein